MIEHRFVYSDEAVDEGASWEFSGLLWKVKDVQRIAPTDFTALTIRIWQMKVPPSAPVGDADLADIVATPANILNAGRGALTDDAKTVNGIAILATRLTIQFTAADSVIVDPASTVFIAPRAKIYGERHLALVEGAYPIGRVYRREIVWTVRNLAKVPVAP